MAVSAEQMNLSQPVVGVFDTTATNNDNKSKVGSGVRIDLLDLLDKKFLPKDRIKNPARRSISILDIMDPPPSVLNRRSSKKERGNKRSMDLIEFLDKRTYLPKTDEGATKANMHRPVSILDVMDPPQIASYVKPKEAIDLVSLLDEKTRLPRDSMKSHGRRKINLVDILKHNEKRT